MTTPEGPDKSPDQSEWGQPPAGGWGDAQHEDPPQDDDRTRPVTRQDREAAAQQGGGAPAPPSPPPPDSASGGTPGSGHNQYGGQYSGGQQGWGGQQGGHDQYGGRHGQQPYGGPQGWGGPPCAGQQQPYGGQQQPPYGGAGPYGGPQPHPHPHPHGGGQQGWGGQAPPTRNWQLGPDRQWGAAPPFPEPPGQPRGGGRRTLPLIITAVVVVLLGAVTFLGFVTPGFFITRVFDDAALSQGVQTVLTNDYDLAVESVSCPENTPVEQGASFQCDVTVAGQPQKVTLTVTDNAGAYEVSRPA